MVSSCVEDTVEKRKKEIEERELEMCHLWVERDFSSIPTALIEKAYKDDWYDAIEILAPTFENYKKGYRKEYQCKIECDECTSEPCRDAYDDWYPKIPMWGWVFAPKDPIDREWIVNHADKVAKCGFIVYETDEIGVYLGVNGAGYDFYEAHWLPLYRTRGLKWHL